MEDNVKFRPSSDVYITRNALLSMGDHTEIGNHFTISVHNIVIIVKGVLTDPHVSIVDHNHEYRNPDVYIYKQGCRAGKDDRVLIDDGTWLGTNVDVMGNVYIGKQCVIGANSVVTKDITDYCVATSSPAKVLKRYNFESKEWERLR